MTAVVLTEDLTPKMTDQILNIGNELNQEDEGDDDAGR